MITRLAALGTLALLLATAGLVFGAAAGTKVGDAATNPKDGAALVWVPAGDFSMGTSKEDVARLLKERPSWTAEGFIGEAPRHTVYLDGYWIYKHEVTVAQYRAFCTATKRAFPEQPKWSKESFPVLNVSWFDARAYAAWAGAALPTEAQWEKAARGGDGRVYPWGSTWDQEKCNSITDHHEAGGGLKGMRCAPVGSYPASASPYGAQDMAGNAWEWCADWYDPQYYKASPRKNPEGPDTGEMKVLRGGSWGSSSITVRCSTRLMEAPDLTYHDCGGFRCVVPAE
jgi:formylglycine-generating enzyme required for sulfatase activity